MKRDGIPVFPLILCGLALCFLSQCTKKPSAEELLTKDALEAFQTFNSTLDTGLNQSAYKSALIPLKVKVDKLPDNEKTLPLKKTVDVLIDGGNLWNISISNSYDSGLKVSQSEVQNYLDKYQGDWAEAKTLKNKSPERQHIGCGEDNYVYSDCVKELGMSLIRKGQENIKAFPKQ